MKIVVVDDDASIRAMAALALEKAGYTVVSAGSVREARTALDDGCDLILCDIYMPGGTGLDLLEEVRDRLPDVPVILMTARGSVETAATAARHGAFDYVAKPFDLGVLLERVRAALAPAPATRAPEPGPESTIVGSHPSIVAVYTAVARVAPLPVPVLLLGETGTGKELVARALHRFGARPGGPFVPVNCGAIPDTLLESELFGHVRGAFTDARRDRRGALAQAHQGTVFLDEIGDISPSFQVKLLRFLQDGMVRPVGADAAEHADVRIVAATHRDIRRMTADGGFREDLFYRLAGYEIVLPPLRDRLEDLPLLVEHVRRRWQEEVGGDTAPASAEVLAVLAAHSWPGNVRELEQTVRRIIIDSGRLTDPAAARRAIAGAVAPGQPAEAPGPAAEESSLEAVERRHILAVLEACGGNRTRAAGILGIERKTLSRKLQRFGIGPASPGNGRDGE